VMEARRLLAPHMLPNTSVADRSRLRDVIFLDLALEVRLAPFNPALHTFAYSVCAANGH
jgi:hypothetical protein